MTPERLPFTIARFDAIMQACSPKERKQVWLRHVGRTRVAYFGCAFGFELFGLFGSDGILCDRDESTQVFLDAFELPLEELPLLLAQSSDNYLFHIYRARLETGV